jgi:hypothetical protein
MAPLHLLGKTAVADFSVPERPDPYGLDPRGDARVPDAIEPIVAYRAWVVDPDLQVRSLNRRATWAPGEWMTARCSRGRHTAPAEGCACGVYASKDLNVAIALAGAFGLPRENEPPRAVFGLVQLAGKVIEHDDGYRAEHAWIAQLLPFEGFSRGTESVARVLGVPVGEAIPSASIPTEDDLSLLGPGPSNERASGGWGAYVIGLVLVAVSNAFSRFAEAQGIDPSGWWIGAIVLAAGLAFAAMLWVQHRWGRRFTQQLRQFGATRPDMQP